MGSFHSDADRAFARSAVPISPYSGSLSYFLFSNLQGYVEERDVLQWEVDCAMNNAAEWFSVRRRGESCDPDHPNLDKFLNTCGAG